MAAFKSGPNEADLLAGAGIPLYSISDALFSSFNFVFSFIIISLKKKKKKKNL